MTSERRPFPSPVFLRVSKVQAAGKAGLGGVDFDFFKKGLTAEAFSNSNGCSCAWRTWGDA